MDFDLLFGKRRHKPLTRVGNAVYMVDKLLKNMEKDPSLVHDNLMLAAWVCKRSVIDNETFPPGTTLAVTMGYKMRVITYEQAITLTLGRLGEAAASHPSMMGLVSEILYGGQAFYDLDSMIPDDKKSKFI